MRMRKRHNLVTRMEKCADLLINDFTQYCPDASAAPQWLKHFPGYEKLCLEIGCGKGRFTADTAEQNPDTMFIAIEKVPPAWFS